MWTDTQLPWETRPVFIPDILAAKPGEKITVELRGGRAPMLVGGEVKWHCQKDSDDTGDHPTVDQLLESASSANIIALKFNAEVWLELRNGEVVDLSARLDQIPSVQPDDVEPSEDPRLWSITYRDDGQIQVGHSEARGDRNSGEIYFGLIPRGEVSAVCLGEVITPQQL